MASIATVVTQGFGTFGSVNLLPTIGYGIGAVVIARGVGMEWTVPRNDMQWTVPINDMQFTVKDD